MNVIKSFTDKYYIRGLPFLLYHSRNLFKKESSIYQDPDGIRIQIDIDNYFQNNILYGYYEYAVRSLMKHFVHEGDWVLDVGANIGYLTCVAGKLAGEKGRVLCFEPVPELNDQIKRNVQLNALNNVTIFPVAVGQNDGVLDFHIGKESALSTAISNAPFMTISRSLKVPVRSIDALILDEQLSDKRIKLVKLDVEGYEYYALKGMRNLIDKKQSVFIIENNPPALQMTGVTLADIGHSFFFPANYKLYWIASKTKQNLISRKRVTTTPVSEKNIHEFNDLAGDYLAVPGSINYNPDREDD